MALSKDDWIQAALLVIAESGTTAVAVEPLAARLGATKGSFYWHFANRDALLQAALEAWEHETTDVAIEQLGQVADPVERLRQLMAFAMNDQDRWAPVDIVLLTSGHDPQVRPTLDRVQANRLGFLERCFQDLGVPKAQIRHRARLAYSAYIGWFDLMRAQPDQAPSDHELAGYQKTVIDLLTRP